MTDFELEPLEELGPAKERSQGILQPWALRADPQCPQGQAKEGHMIEVASDEQPPAACEGSTCGCRYVPMPERRKGERRKGEDRREMLRFEKKTDRRKGDRRKGRDVWKARGR